MDGRYYFLVCGSGVCNANTRASAITDEWTTIRDNLHCENCGFGIPFRVILYLCTSINWNCINIYMDFFARFLLVSSITSQTVTATVKMFIR